MGSKRRIGFFIAVAIAVVAFILFLRIPPHQGSRIVVLKYITHLDLDEHEESFIKRLRSNVNGNPTLSNIEIEKYNAGGNQQRAMEYARLTTDPHIKLILAIGTPAAQAVFRTESPIPLLYGAVANPKDAGLIPSARATGIQNASPQIIDQAVAFIHTMFPGATRIGTLYNPSEQNSVGVQKLIQASCDARNLQLIQVTVNDSSQVFSRAEYLASQVDVIYSANDNTVNSGVASVVQVATNTRKPFVIGDLSTLAKGPLAAVGLDYGEMGKDLADMAVDILSGKPLSEIPPRPAPPPQIWINESALKELGLSVPSSLADHVTMK